MTRWSHPATELPALQVLPAEIWEGMRRAAFHRSQCKAQQCPTPSSYKHLYDAYSMSQCGFAGTVFSSLPHIHHTPYMMHTLDLMLQGQPYSSTAPFP